MLFITTPTRWVTPQVACISNVMVNMFLFRKGDDIIAIDAGFNEGMVRRGLKKLGVDPLSVSKVFLTHSDYDHAACVHVFANAVLHMGTAESVLVEKKAERFKKRFNEPLSRIYQPVADGERIASGGITVQAFATPGHTTGSTSWLVDGACLFVGDALTLSFGRVHIMPSFINMDTAEHRKTIRALAKKTKHRPLSGVKWLFTAHSGYTARPLKALEHWQ
jgi:glyoxylase-like metal-dependent hydrolase (beta-lactamase superfamily II)